MDDKDLRITDLENRLKENDKERERLLKEIMKLKEKLKSYRAIIRKLRKKV